MIETPTRVEASRRGPRAEWHGHGESCEGFRQGTSDRKEGVVLPYGAPACFPVISQGETSNDPGNQDNS